MKKFSLLVSIIALICSLTSCNNSESLKDLQFEKFKNDENLKVLVKYSEELNTLNKNQQQNFSISEEELLSACLEMEVDYGEQLVLDYIDLLERQNYDNVQIDGDDCHRNSNGTVNMTGCSFWGKVKAVFSAAINCGPGEATDWYYDCVQSSVCRNC